MQAKPPTCTQERMVQLTPYALYLGNDSTAGIFAEKNNKEEQRALEALREARIEGIVSCGALPFAFASEGIKYARFLPKDADSPTNEGLRNDLVTVTNFVADCLDEDRGVLVHCTDGFSSPTVAIAYLMKWQQMHFSDAMEFVAAIRLINNSSHWKFLKGAFEAWCFPSCTDLSLRKSERSDEPLAKDASDRTLLGRAQMRISALEAEVVRLREELHEAYHVGGVRTSTPTTMDGDAIHNLTLADPSADHGWRRGKLIGKGSYGRVYQALDLETGQMMAVKKLDLEARVRAQRGALGFRDTNQEHVDTMAGLIHREISVLTSLPHPHIVSFLGTERTGENFLHVFMEFVSGGSIGALLKVYNAFPVPLVRHFTRQVLSALEHLHRNLIIHRDIKGDNILVTPGGVAKLADFGASRRLAGEHLLAPISMGSPYWMAPEVVRNQGSGRKSDVWSLGCTVLEMLTTAPPFLDLEPLSALFRIGSLRPPDTPPLPPDLDDTTTGFLVACFTIDVAARPTSQDLLSDPFFVART